MSTELEQLIRANPEAAKAIIIKIEAEPKPKWDTDKWFNDLTKELRTRPSPHEGRILHDGLVNGEWITLFDQNVKTATVYCRYKYVWAVLEEHFSPEYDEVQAKLKHLLEEHRGWRVETPETK